MTPAHHKVILAAFVIYTAPPITHADIIRPASLVTEEYAHSSATAMIDNKGMKQTVDNQEATATALVVKHCFDEHFEASFVSLDLGGLNSDFFKELPNEDNDVDLVFDLTGGGDTTIQSVIFWQYQNVGTGKASLGNDARSIEVRINSEAQGATHFLSAPTLLTLKPVTDGDNDPSNDLGGVNSAQAFFLARGSIRGRYAQISITDNYLGYQGITSGGDRVGLGEIRFTSNIAKSLSQQILPPSSPPQSLISIGGFSLALKAKP